MRVVVIGAGVAGVMTAYELAAQGHEVVVVERCAGPADETSFGNGGVLGATQVEPWAQPGMPLHLLRWLGREDAPLLLRLGQLPHMWRWGVKFLANCNEAAFHRAMSASLRLTRYSLARFAALREATGLSFDHRAGGALKVYGKPAELEAFARKFEASRGYGMRFSVLDRAGCARIEPALAAAPISGGILFPEDETGDCRKFTQAMAGMAARAGVEFRFATPVAGIEHGAGRAVAVTTAAGRIAADAIVVACASHTPGLLAPLGIRVPICPVKGVSITVPVVDWPDAVRGAVIDHTRLFGLIRLGDRLRVSGSAEITGFDTTPAPSRCAALTRAALELFPALAPSLAASPPLRWAGLRGVSPDGPPIIGRTPIANLFVNAGHGPQGWSTSHGCARIVADLVGGREPEIEIAGLELDRYGDRHRAGA
ncbi:MAG: D-amino acid dehydrogenase [Alphaproteobacteria bacterium]|nr:D-amino acid dehydrogenase [Alphaproteobacteria bacterium]